MQDRYTGDVGDFGKYGLLRWLCGQDTAPLRLGVIWYRTDSSIINADPPNDGKHVEYLQAEQEHSFRPRDPPLYDGLREIVSRGDRRVQAVAQSGLLGADTSFHDDHVPGPPAGASGQARIIPRRRWAEHARRVTQGCDLVFLDPDNGLASPSVPITRAKAPKYAYLDDVEGFFGRGQSVAIYHHLGRNGAHAEQVAHWCERLQQSLDPGDIFALRLHRGTARAFFVLATANHASLLRKRATALLDSPWGEHFTLMP